MTATNVPSSLMPTLGGRYYTDPAIFRAEQEKIFEVMWHCAVRASDLDRPGRFQTLQVGRESILVVRAPDGEVRAFLNVCRHRGSRLCGEGSGETRRSFRCPYHSWTYGLDGHLVAAPNLVNMPDVDRAALGLVRVAVREWLGYVWVCLADEPPSFDDDVVGAATVRLGDADAIGHYQVADLQVGHSVRYDVRANWKLLIENFMECYHCATIHPELTRVLPEFTQGYAAQYYLGHGAEFGPGIQGFTVDGRPGLDKIPGVDAERDRRYYAITIKPQVFVNLVPDHAIIHRMSPVAVDRTIIDCDWLYLPEVVSSGRDVSSSVELFHRVNQQDFDACERCQPSMGSRAYATGGTLVPSEHHIGGFHEWVLARLSADR